MQWVIVRIKWDDAYRKCPINNNCTETPEKMVRDEFYMYEFNMGLGLGP